jgi:uncharacterized membrane protein YqaE (UPF0057 family)
VRLIEVILCFFFPWLAVLLKKGLDVRVLVAFVLQLLGHIPGVIYGLFVVLEE